METLGIERVPGQPRRDPSEVIARIPEIERYCSVIANSTDLEEIQSVDGMLNFFHTQTPTSHCGEVMTFYLGHHMKRCLESPTIGNLELVQDWRCYAMAHSLRAMAQGSEYSIFHVRRASELIARYIDSVEGTSFEERPQGNRRIITREMAEVISFVPWFPNLVERFTLEKARLILETTAPSTWLNAKAATRFTLGSMKYGDQAVISASAD